ncbi:AraC family transcriptional regulator [Longitalea luteola]|uniref:AraC family transcriptional regulator n=1 Tax=Longitalea luteola TaxID=2812563 RepID=UPI001A95FD36|nr:AraC family transcriptional regulator [Longitalea luteola]
MKPLLIENNLDLKCTVDVKVLNTHKLDNPFHFHNSYELVLVLKSNGYRIVGDNVESFHDGDLVLLGPNLPHVWYNEKAYYEQGSVQEVKAIVVYFSPEWLNEKLLNFAELFKVKELFKKSSHGLKISGETKQRVISSIMRLPELKGLKCIIEILSIIDLLSETEEYTCLASPGYINSYNQKDARRIDKVYQYVMENFTENIFLEEAAALINMTPTAFCRYFKSRTKKTFTHFVNEVRIGHATKLLCNENLNISDVCYHSGFNNPANFNKTFKDIKKMTPKEFRMNIGN